MKLSNKNYNRIKDSFNASKSIITLIGLTIMLQYSAFAQNDCSKFYPFTKGTSFQITSYNKKGKTVAVSNYAVQKIQKINNAKVATISVSLKDNKGKEIGSSSYHITCTGNEVSVDYNSLMNSELFKQFKNMKYKISGKNLIIPNTLSTGQSLPDAGIEIKVNMGGFNMHITNSELNRKVIDKEKISTPAGTFNCFVITYTSKMKSTMVNRIGKGKQWIAKGVGLVKEEDYNRKGSLVNSSVLTAFNKN